MADEALINEITRRVLEALNVQPSAPAAQPRLIEAAATKPAASSFAPPAAFPKPNPVAGGVVKHFVTADEAASRLGPDKSLKLAANERLTPNAQDYVELYHVRLDRQATPAAAPVAAPSAGVLAPTGPIGLVVFQGDAKVAIALTALGREGLSLPRFDATDCWMQNSSAMLKALLAGQLGGGVIVLPDGVAAMVYANKYRGIRAALGLCADSVAEAVRGIDANVLVVEHAGRTFHEIRTLIKTFIDARHRSRTAPSILETFARLEGRA